MTSQALILASVILSFGLIVAAVAFGSAVGDGVIGSKAVEAIARQPEARPNIFTFYFLGVGILEAFPVIALGLALYLFFAVGNVPGLIANVK
ncbi:MAG TPA: ATP synthase F0 subunit C [Candidatus Baltobacteraceae bacterium]|nr:ATP synthase F0 subunit C [Candidatus Baltobacteraceae bacterium]